MSKAKFFLFSVFNVLYKRAYFLYKPLYFTYKRISDKEKIAFIKKHVKEGMTVVDIGANIGFYTILLSQLVGKKGRVYTFEPDPNNYKHLQSNVKTLSNVIIEQAACGLRTEKIRLFESATLNVDHTTYDTGDRKHHTEVACIALDDYFKNKTVDFVKIDIQGYDYYAIKGMERVLKRMRHIVILGEFWPYGLYKAKTTPKEYTSFLRKMGFKVTLFDLDALKRKNMENRYYYSDFVGIKE